MSEAEKYIEMMIDADVEKIIISNPASKQSEYKKTFTCPNIRKNRFFTRI